MKKKKSSAQRKNTSKKSSSAGNSNVDLTQKVYTTMEKHKEVFFTIRLHSAQSAASLSPICDPDVPMVSKKTNIYFFFVKSQCLISTFSSFNDFFSFLIQPCELMDGRDAFLTMARERHYEFSSLRRCKYSTMSLLYELHTQGNDKFVYTCNSCNKSVETRYVQYSIMIMILFYFISKIDRFPPTI